MKQSKFVYYADMLIYPGIILGFLLQDLIGRRFVLHPRFWLAFLAGTMLWTLLEYVLHRFVYHEVAGIKELHGMHHEHPNDLVGSPLWSTLAAFLVLSIALVLLAGVEIGSGLTLGLMLGYVAYLVVHDGVHRWQLRENSWMRSYRLWHLRHHRHPVPCNFGVTTGFWDIVFGTAVASERAHGTRPVASSK